MPETTAMPAYDQVEAEGFFCYSGADGDLYRHARCPGWRISLGFYADGPSMRIQQKGLRWRGQTSWPTRLHFGRGEEARFLAAVRHLKAHGTIEGWCDDR